MPREAMPDKKSDGRGSFRSPSRMHRTPPEFRVNLPAIGAHDRDINRPQRRGSTSNECPRLESAVAAGESAILASLGGIPGGNSPIWRQIWRCNRHCHVPLTGQ
jgi:hypothetical protein